MERIHTLINKLQEQLQQGATKEQMLYTAQLLVAELGNEPIVQENKVSVLMPTSFISSPNENVIRVEVEDKKVEEIKKIEIVEEVVHVEEENATQQITETTAINIIEEPIEKVIETTIEPVVEVVIETPKQETLFFTKPSEKIVEINLVKNENKVVYELNDIAQEERVSVNDKLKESRVEVGSAIVDAPVKDLRKAIGINDKYLFINELFSQDESMYERSIKTINNFGTYKEAEQWINRELYTKLCWLKDNKIVDNFYTLVKRRFAEM